MKDYYQILRVRRGAGLPEIRRAYRVLVQQLHPDVNPDPAAHELIKEVNEAYDVLSDAAKKQAYDHQLENPYSTISQEPVHRDPYFRRPNRPPRAKPEKTARIQLMERSLTFFRWVFKVSAAFCFLLLVDFLIPRSVSTEQIVESYETRARSRSGRTHHVGYTLVTDSGYRFNVEDEYLKFFEDDPVVRVYKSRILSITTRIETESNSYALTNFASVYNNFSFLPILIGIGAVIGLVVKKGTLDFNFSLGLVILVLLGITLKLML